MSISDTIKAMREGVDLEFEAAAVSFRCRLNAALLLGTKTPDEIVATPGFVDAVVAIMDHEREKAARS